MTAVRYEQKPLDVDVVILGKGIGAGYPIGVVAGKSKFIGKGDGGYMLKVNKTIQNLQFKVDMNYKTLSREMMNK